MRLAPIVLVIAAGCAKPAPDVDHARDYKDENIALRYPANWAFEKTQKMVGTTKVTTLSISAEEGFAMIYVAVPKTEVQLETYRGMLMKRMGDAIQKATASGGKLEEKREKVERAVGGAKGGDRVKLTLSGGTQRLELTQELYDASTDKASIVVMTQAADTSLERDRPGYELVLGSLKSN